MSDQKELEDFILSKVSNFHPAKDVLRICLRAISAAFRNAESPLPARKDLAERESRLLKALDHFAATFQDEDVKAIHYWVAREGGPWIDDIKRATATLNELRDVISKLRAKKVFCREGRPLDETNLALALELAMAFWWLTKSKPTSKSDTTFDYPKTPFDKFVVSCAKAYGRLDLKVGFQGFVAKGVSNWKASNPKAEAKGPN